MLVYQRVIPKILLMADMLPYLEAQFQLWKYNHSYRGPIFQSIALRIHNYHGLNPNFTAKYGKTG